MTIGSKITIGSVYGSWTVVSRTSDRRRVKFVCKCSCGREVVVLAQNLANGNSKQCRSCASHQRAHLISIPRGIYARLYHQARGAIRRCSDASNKHYAGRGISVDPRWAADIQLFVEYLASLPGCNDPSLVLDRENNDGGYVVGNLRFVTHSESNYNRRPPNKKRRVT